jgi:thioredoxin 1
MNDAPLSSPPSNQPALLPQRGKFNFWRWFWISTLVVSLGWVWYDFYVPSNSIAWAENYSSAQQQSAVSGKPIILFFTGNWCVPCRIMKRNVWADAQVTASVNSAFIPVTIDVDDPDSAPTMRRYSIVGTPVTIIADTEGNVLQLKEGGISKRDFLEMLAKQSPSRSQ